MIKKLIVLSIYINVFVVGMDKERNRFCNKKVGEMNLYEAARYVEEGQVVRLLQQGVDVNMEYSSGETALYGSCKPAHKGIMKLLLDAGADHRAEGRIGFTPLHEACYWSNAEAVEILIQYGAPLDAQSGNSHGTPLHVACQNDDIASVRLLLAAGARRDIKNVVGKTPIEYTTNPEIRSLFDEGTSTSGGAAGAAAACDDSGINLDSGRIG